MQYSSIVKKMCIRDSSQGIICVPWILCIISHRMLNVIEDDVSCECLSLCGQKTNEGKLLIRLKPILGCKTNRRSSTLLYCSKLCLTRSQTTIVFVSPYTHYYFVVYLLPKRNMSKWTVSDNKRELPKLINLNPSRYRIGKLVVREVEGFAISG